MKKGKIKIERELPTDSRFVRYGIDMEHNNDIVMVIESKEFEQSTDQRDAKGQPLIQIQDYPAAVIG